MSRLLLLPPLDDLTHPSRQDASLDPAKLIALAFGETVEEAQQRLDAIKTRRGFRVIQGGKR